MNSLFVSPKEKHRKKIFRRLKLYALIIVIIFLFWGIYYLFAELSIFKINSLEISGGEKLSKAQIMNEVTLEVLSGYRAKLLGLNNIFSWPNGSMQTNNQLLAGVLIEKDILHRNIKVNVSERRKYGAWCEMLTLNSSKCFWFDKDGIIFDSAPDTNGKLIFKINSKSLKTFSIGSGILEPSLFNNLKIVLERLKNNFIVEDFNFNTESLDLETKIIDGPKLIFNLKFNPETSLIALKEINNKKIMGELKIIDLRIPNKIFYR